MQPKHPPATNPVPRPSAPTLAETVIRVYNLQALIPAFQLRSAAVLKTNGDVTFTSLSSSGEKDISTHSALFSVAAAAKGRPAVPIEKFGKVTVSSDGKREVRCGEEGFGNVKRIYGHVVNKTGEQMDRLLDEALRYNPDEIRNGSPDFMVELEAEEGEQLVVETKAAVKESVKRRSLPGRTSLGKGKQVTAAKEKTGSTADDKSSDSKPPPAAYAEIHIHKFLLSSSIPYYKYLSLAFSDSTSDTSSLPYPTITFLALKILQRWLYNPLRIGEVLEEYQPNAHCYLLTHCKRGDKTGYPPPLSTATILIEVARAGDFLGIEELGVWAEGVLRKMCHNLSRCGGTGCRSMLPHVLNELHKSGGLGLSPAFSTELKTFLASNVVQMWKRPVIGMADEVLEELVEAFKGLHSDKSEKFVSKKKKKDAEGVESSRALQWWQMFLDLNQVRVSIGFSASANLGRWMEKLIGPAMEHCVHQITREFNDPRLAADLQSKMEDGSFHRDIVLEMLEMVTMASVFNVKDGRELSVPLEKPPLSRKTVKAVFEGIVNLRTWDGKDGEWGAAERRVVEFLHREWMTIVAGGEAGHGKSGFASWRPAMLTVLSKKLRVSVDDLLGKGEKKKGFGLQPVPLKGGVGKVVVKDSLGNDIEVDASTAEQMSKKRNTQRTIEEDEAGPSTLRPEADAFVPSGVSVL